jgi:hypothetical protein
MQLNLIIIDKKEQKGMLPHGYFEENLAAPFHIQ